MLDNYLLQELVTFSATGTLAKTAAKLNVTQPTVTRGMQKLDIALGVRLFERQPNRLSLTVTGELAAKEATKLLQTNHQLVTTVRNFDPSQQRLRIGMSDIGPWRQIIQRAISGARFFYQKQRDAFIEITKHSE
ncbi:hypothetical protein MH1LPH_24240 [Lactiplantibacillus brownii]